MLFLRKKNEMARQRLTQSAWVTWYILDKQIFFGEMSKKYDGVYLIQGRI